MSLAVKIRRGEGPFWGGLKRLARAALRVHLPAGGPLRPLFRGLYLLHVAAREGLAWLLRFAWYEPLFRSRCAAVGEGLRMERLPYLTGAGRLILGSYVELSGKSDIGFANRHRAAPEIVVGDGTFLGHRCNLNAADSIRIGRHCLIAEGVLIADHDGHPLDAASRRAGEPEPASSVRPVRIGDDVWIGNGAKILKGVTIGDRSIVGAGSVVARDVPPDVVVAGNPARVVKRLEGGSPPPPAAREAIGEGLAT